MFGLWKRSHHPGSTAGRHNTVVHGMLRQSRHIEGGNMNKKIYVANLPYQATESELKALFSKAGDVVSVKIVQDRQTGQPRGIAFVEMSTQWEGRRAASMFNRQDFLGKNLLVKEATEKRGFRGR
jgi:RNA recognition motif-containing protein